MPTALSGPQDRSPRRLARIAGVFYLITFIAGVISLFVRGTLGVTANVVATVAYVVVTLLLYRLFRPVSEAMSLVAALFGLGGCVVGALRLLHITGQTVNPLVLFGFYCLLLGYLISRSAFMPRILGLLMAFAGIGWLTFLSPALAKALRPYNFAPGVIGELVFTLWLLIVGVNVQRWNEQARTA